MFKPSQYPKILAIYISLLAIVWSIYPYRRGAVMSPDSGTYSWWADTLIKYNFDIFKFLENVTDTIPPVFYSAWVTIVAFNKVLLGENWGLGVVALNLLAGISVAILLLKTTWTVTAKPTCVIFAGLFLLACHDFFLWIPYVLSDTLFSFICFLIFILSTSLYQQPANLSKRVIGVALLLLFALFFRPTWPPLLIFALLSMPLAFFFSLMADDTTKRHNFIIGCTLLACILIPAIIFYHAYIMLHPEKWPFPFFDSILSIVSHDYQQGKIIDARPETYHSLPKNIFDYSLISFHKIFAYFYIDLAAYSFKHVLFNYIFFPPVYGLSILAITKLFKKNNGPSPLNWWCIFSCTLFIFLFAFFHSLEQIDYDFRYRVPCYPPLILLAALGLNELINGFSKRA